MTLRLAELLLALSANERRLLAILCGLVLPLAVIFLWVLPLADRGAAAQRDLSTARALMVWVTHRIEESAALVDGQTNAIPKNGAPVGLSGIEKGLNEAGLRPYVTRLAGRDDGAVELVIEDAPFATVTAWTSAVRPVWGYRIVSFHIQRTDRAGQVAAEFLLGETP